MEHTVCWLKRCDRSDFLDTLDLLDCEIGNANVPHFPFFGEFCHRLESLLDIFFRLIPVHLVKVYHIDA